MDEDWIPAPGYDVAGFESAAGYSTIGHYRPDRQGRCKANNDTCKARCVKGQTMCVGHLRQAQKVVTSEHTG